MIARLLAVTLLAACSESTGPTTPVATWSLTSVNAKALPTTMYAETGYTLDVTSGEITLSADSTYTNDVKVTETVDGNVSVYTDHVAGRWIETSSGQITLTPTDEQPMLATWSGSTLTVTSDVTLVYTRR